ncbi:hypothetical protein FXO37_28656 [Capsicum annuum]|nr:hypothetical protein FXO37_28656 [Capsicum annuum]
MMVDLEMLKNGFVPGRRLGVNLDGILESIQLPRPKSTSSLGYEPTPEEVLSYNLKRRSDILLSKPILLLNQDFPKCLFPKYQKKMLKKNSLKESKTCLLLMKKLSAM